MAASSLFRNIRIRWLEAPHFGMLSLGENEYIGGSELSAMIKNKKIKNKKIKIKNKKIKNKKNKNIKNHKNIKNT